MSEIRATTISNAAGTGPATLTGQSAAKAWFDLDGTGTAALNDSFNVSSVTDNGTGDYTLNFSNSFALAQYGFGGNALGTASGTVIVFNPFSYAASSLRVAVENMGIFSSARIDRRCNGNFHGDLA